MAPKDDARSRRSGVSDGQLRDWLIASEQGDAAAYDRLVRAVRPILIYYCRVRLAVRSETIEDVVQDVFLALHNSRARFDGQRALLPWLFAIARNRFIDRLRAEQRMTTLRGISQIEEDWRFEDRLHASLDIERLLDQLPLVQAEMIRRTKLRGQSGFDVVAETGMGRSAVKVSVHRGLARLRARVARFGA